MKEIPLGKELYGMVIDLDKCTGCGACAVACMAENNIAFRDGRNRQVAHGHLDAALPFEQRPAFPQDPGGLFAPSLHALPTPHALVFRSARSTPPRSMKKGWSARSIPAVSAAGTVWPPAPTMPGFSLVGSGLSQGMENYLSPDVSVAMRGVVHKCTFCNHRYQRAKDRAFMEERRDLKEGEYNTACAEACPTQAIAFGNLQNPESLVAQLSKGPKAFRLLEKLGSQPKVYYLTSQEWIQRQD